MNWRPRHIKRPPLYAEYLAGCKPYCGPSAQAERLAPSIIFLDELDALVPARTSGTDQVFASLVSTLLCLMDGLHDRGAVIVLGATNRRALGRQPALQLLGYYARLWAYWST